MANMNSITLNLNKEQLLGLMKDFHLLTGIKIALFGIDGSEILSYPEGHCDFCAVMQSHRNTAMKCKSSNIASFDRCRRSQQIDIFHCYAGLIEATAPLIENDSIIGYIMFGQITDEPDKSRVREMLSDVISNSLSESSGFNASVYSITYKNNEQILAAAKILEACTFYVLLKDMVSLQRETFINNFNTFLLSHLSEDLSIDRLTAEFHISRNRLYDSCSRYLRTGIADHIRNLRIEEAKRLLRETDLTVREISDRVGFTDYNYFCRIFKKLTGQSSRVYRAINR